MTAHGPTHPKGHGPLPYGRTPLTGFTRAPGCTDTPGHATVACPPPTVAAPAGGRYSGRDRAFLAFTGGGTTVPCPLPAVATPAGGRYGSRDRAIPTSTSTGAGA